MAKPISVEPCKRPDHLAANSFSDHEDAPRHDVAVTVSPDVDLQLDAGAEFLEPLAFADDNGVVHGAGEGLSCSLA